MTGLNDVKVEPNPAFPLDEQTQEDFFGHSHTDAKLFDITLTRVVGSVYAGNSGVSPRVVAFSIIAEAGEGNFQFPNENGTTCYVDVVNGDPRGSD